MDNHSPDHTEEQINQRSARKYWWLLMLLPIGLAVGTITSLVQHLRKDQIEQEQAAFKVAVELNVQDIGTAMDGALVIGERNMESELGRKNIRSTRRFIEGVVSPGGTGLQFQKVKSTNIDEKTVYQSYVDITKYQKDKLENKVLPLKQERQVIAVLIELEGEKTRGNAAKLAIIPSVIRSLAEFKPETTLRFILAPARKDLSGHLADTRQQLLGEKETLLALIVLKEKPDATAAEANDWTTLSGDPQLLETLKSNTQFTQSPGSPLSAELTHPALLNEKAQEITEPQVNVALTAASQLRDMLMNASR
ncbi:hypothetical protein SAMN02745181_2202 [Rubritalea squalenifaciens DSM 18772]|uniref:Uncharacterized protein n=1 Tax=Rubritalea squalenifaciens DSM 18772 TaxID=1123071 RepID=A0A1M6KTN7_9BACT|nr:hypothetical protein [Rubritalea squalenifaciens]SHJ62283.1 hypothetical protein SAMN02745181_2202 [Rubritalea squalenifaciens DSM 18772]